jgi:hypothetical protein
MQPLINIWKKYMARVVQKVADLWCNRIIAFIASLSPSKRFRVTYENLFVSDHYIRCINEIYQPQLAALRKNSIFYGPHSIYLLSFPALYFEFVKHPPPSMLIIVTMSPHCCRQSLRTATATSVRSWWQGSSKKSVREGFLSIVCANIKNQLYHNEKEKN